MTAWAYVDADALRARFDAYEAMIAVLVERGIVPACCAAEAVEVRRQLLNHQLARISAALN